MRADWKHIEKYRISFPGWESKFGDHFGCFRFYRGKTMIRVIATDTTADEKWEHVSVSVSYKAGGKKWVERTPTWEEMNSMKDLFFEKNECVLQFHPPESQYVNLHKHCLHLWRPIGVQIEAPQPMLV